MNGANVIIRDARELASLSALCPVSIDQDVHLPKPKRFSPDAGFVCTFLLDFSFQKYGK